MYCNLVQRIGIILQWNACRQKAVKKSVMMGFITGKLSRSRHLQDSSSNAAWKAVMFRHMLCMLFFALESFVTH